MPVISSLLPLEASPLHYTTLGMVSWADPGVMVHPIRKQDFVSRVDHSPSFSGSNISVTSFCVSFCWASTSPERFRAWE